MPASLNRRDWLALTGGAALTSLLPFGLRAEEPREPFVFRNVNKDQLHWHTEDVPNAEPTLPNLVKSWRTPVEQFYVRSHAPAPKIDLDGCLLKVEGLVKRPLELSIRDLLDMEHVTTTATLTCAGNRRTEHNAVEPVKGVPWQAGAIGTTSWTGVPLKTLLERAGVWNEARHVWFEGLDEIEKGDGTIGFGGSIPIEKALAMHGNVPGALVAHRMDGKPLTRDHGFPVRTIVPGYIGARSVKWLGRIVVSDEPSPNHYLATAYKIVQRDDPLTWAEAGPIYNFAINSVIATIAPLSGTNDFRVEGYAVPPGDGRTIAKVELSADSENWQAAEITSEKSPFCWVLWRANVRMPEGATSLVVRATDSDGRVQPRTVPWNLKGYMFNAWHRQLLPGVQP